MKRIQRKPISDFFFRRRLACAEFLVLALVLGAVSSVSAQGTKSTSLGDSEFWDSVYSDNHVLDIQITVTDDNWKAMQPAQQQRGGRGGPPNGPPGFGPPGFGPPGFGPPGFGPPEGRQRGGRPDGPPGGGPPGGNQRGGQRGGGPPPQGGGRQGGGRQGGGRQGGPPQGGPPGGGATEFTYVKAELTVDGEKYTDIGLRFKGNSSYRMAANSFKRPLKIDTNKFNKDQMLHGRDKLNLSNAVFDSAFMKEKLGYGLYKSAGLATPGVGWANVTLTIGKRKVPLGIYVLIEQLDKRFLESHFGEESKGSLLMKPEVSQWEYLGDTAEDYAAYDIKYGEDDDALVKKFAELLKLIDDGTDSEFRAQIGQRFDLPKLAGYLAATSLLSSLDSYVAAPHNYYLMLSKADGKLRLLPWDVNESFAAHDRGSNITQLVDWDIDRPWTTNHRLLERLFETDEFPAMYRTALEKLTPEFTAKKLFPRIEEYRTAIAPHIGKYKSGPGTKGLDAGIDGNRHGINQSVDRQVLAIKPFILRRHESVTAQLAGKREGQVISSQRGR